MEREREGNQGQVGRHGEPILRLAGAGQVTLTGPAGLTGPGES